MKISLCLTTMNRVELTLESFSKVIDHPLIDEIIIVEDCGDLYQFTQLYNAVAGMKKVKLFRNQENLGMSRNKAEATSRAKNEWCIILDSDNILYPEYLDSIPINLIPSVIYLPVFAEPNFDYRQYEGQAFSKTSIGGLMREKMFICSMNTCNYLVNREKYLQVYEHNETVKEADTIWMAYLWLKAGYSFYFVPGMVYYHRVHSGSGWLSNKRENTIKANEIQELIKQL